MKTLSIRQPWAWAILNAGKDIENRTWSTKYRGKFQIHASKTIDYEGYRFLHAMGLLPPPTGEIDTGGIVGTAEIVDVVTSADSHWFFGPVGFVLENAEKCEFKPCNGKLMLYEYEI